jgi:hypothetical protein
VRLALQQELTAVRYECGEDVWFNTFEAWVRALDEVVGVFAWGIAVTDLRFLTDIRESAV